MKRSGASGRRELEPNCGLLFAGFIRAGFRTGSCLEHFRKIGENVVVAKTRVRMPFRMPILLARVSFLRSRTRGHPPHAVSLTRRGLRFLTLTFASCSVVLLIGMNRSYSVLPSVSTWIVSRNEATAGRFRSSLGFVSSASPGRKLLRATPEGVKDFLQRVRALWLRWHHRLLLLSPSTRGGKCRRWSWR